DTSDRVRALEAGADDYMTKPVDRVELVARVSSALRLKGVYDSLDGAEQVIFALAAAVEAKDPFTEAHTQRVAESARAVGAWLGPVVAVCDAFDALVNDRPYRSRKTVDEALTTLRAGAGRQWDPRVVDAFLACVPSLTARGAA